MAVNSAKVERPCALSVAGFDPSAGAGVLADVKVFESSGVYGIAAVSAITRQNDRRFLGIRWLTAQEIIEQLVSLHERFRPEVVKVGIIESIEALDTVIESIKGLFGDIPILWDPVIKSSTGFVFLQRGDARALRRVLNSVALITPNRKEVETLLRWLGEQEGDVDELARHCPVYVTDGEGDGQVRERLVGSSRDRDFFAERISTSGKHGSGCVFSSRIAGEIARGVPLEQACELAGEYARVFLESSQSAYGFHLERCG